MTALTPRELPGLLGIPLSDEQLQAATAPLAPQLIVAGAGTGKTTVMAARVVWLIATGQVRADEVLGLTFTNKAAHELRQRIRRAASKIPSDAGANDGDPSVMTYNGFAAQLITQFGPLTGVESDARLIADGQRARLAYSVACHPVDDTGLEGSPDHLARLVRELDDTCAGLDIALAELRRYDTDLLRLLESATGPAGLLAKMKAAAVRRQVLAGLVEQFRAAKHAGEWLDFSDQVRLGSDLAHRFPLISTEMCRRFRIVLLDEYQDTSRAQRRTLQALFGAGHAVTAVGDPCQAIYGWRGASVTNIDQFPRQFPCADGTEAAVHTLTVNRRSLPTILAAGNDIAAGLRQVHSQVRPLRAPAEVSGGSVRTALLATRDDELLWLGDELRNASQRHTWSDMAVLCRSNDQVADVVDHLRTVGVPCHVSSRRDLLGLPEVATVVALLRILVDPHANPDVLHHLIGPRWRIGPRDLATLGRRAAALAEETGGPGTPVSLLDAIRDPGDPTLYAFSDEARERLSDFAAELDGLAARTDRPVPDLVSAVVDLLAPGIVAIDEPQLPASLSALVDLSQGFRSLDGGRGLADLVAYLDDCARFATSPEEPTAGSGAGVAVMTMHAAKGLEFPVVALPFWCTSVFPSALGGGRWVTSALALPPVAPDEPDPALTLAFPGTTITTKDHDAYMAACRRDDRHDEDRLAYVAITRAESEVIASGHWWGPTQNTPRGPSDYLRILRRLSPDTGPWLPEAGERPDREAATALLEAWPAAVQRPGPRAVADLVLQPIPPNHHHGEPAGEPEWDTVLSALEADLAASPPTAGLPTVVSASTVLQWLRDPQRYLEQAARPMPRRPSRAADTGVRFHAWLEHQVGQQSLFDFDDDGRLHTEEGYTAAFSRTRYADRTPHSVEEPFVIALADLVVTGRIDAIFRVDDDDRFEWEVVDWKTGSPAGADPLQLALYRTAWARRVGCSPERVRGVFVFLADGSDVTYDDLPDLGQQIADATGK